MPESDQTVWSGLLKGAQNGKLKLLNVDLAEFKKLITACEAFVADIIGLSTATGQNFPPTVWTIDNKAEKLEEGGTPTFEDTTLESMRLLFERYERKRLTDLVEALKDHQTLITTMADTFSRAHSSYKNTDDANATTFNTPATGTDHWPRIWKEHSVPNKSWKDGPGESTTAGSGAPFDPNVKKDLEGFIEHGYQFGLYDFANIRLIIEKNAGNVPWIAGEWRAFADIWRHSVLSFKTALSPVFTAGHWQGEGAEQAVAFLTKYLDTAKSMENSLMSMSNVIGNTANFMSYVHNNLPFYSEIEVDDNGVPTKVGTHNASSHINVIRDFWDTGYDGTGRLGYRDGMSQIMGWVPTFADPIALTAAPPVTPNNGGGGTGGGGGNDNNNKNNGDKQSGGGSGGGGGGDKKSGAGGGGANPNDKKASASPGSGTGGKGSNLDPSAFKPSSSKSSTEGPSGATGPEALSSLSKALQELTSGLSGATGSPLTTAPLGATGPQGATGAVPFGFDLEPAGLRGGGGGGGSAGGGSSSPTAKAAEDKLFPRATTAGKTAEALETRAGMAQSAAMPYGSGYPMGGGGMGGGAQGGQQQQQRKRAAYLDGTEHLEEAVGEDPLSVRPIIDR